MTDRALFSLDRLGPAFAEVGLDTAAAPLWFTGWRATGSPSPRWATAARSPIWLPMRCADSRPVLAASGHV